MLTLIDGYNLMHAKQTVSTGREAGGLRHARTRFLDVLAGWLGPLRSATTTVVFDSARFDPRLDKETMHKQMQILFAVGDENADARIEHLIAAHPKPRELTVVSSDRRIRRAAQRRRCRLVTSDEFWSQRQDLPLAASNRRNTPDEPSRLPIGKEELEHWLKAFSDVDEVLAGEPGAPGGLDAFAPTTEQMERIAKEVAGEELRFPKK
jgi:predicted RNA-binding protein with PIN domain